MTRKGLKIDLEVEVIQKGMWYGSGTKQFKRCPTAPPEHLLSQSTLSEVNPRKMLCKHCSSIKFRTFQKDEVPAQFYSPMRDDLVHILHRERASYIEALALGCSLCTFIQGRLHKTDSIAMPVAYRLMTAYIILTCSSRDAKAIRVVSPRGTAMLRMIDPIPGLTRSLTLDCVSYYGT